MSETPFSGLTMPVFNAFGWAEQEAAITYALSELDVFVKELHQQLPAELRAIFPHAGVDPVEHFAYLKAESQLDDGLHITFSARPLTFTITVGLTNRRWLIKLLRAAGNEADTWHMLLSGLESEWMLRIQQMQVVDEAASHYQDVFKDSVSELNLDKTKEITERAHYLNSEEKWLAPVFLSRRFNSEQVSGMGTGVLQAMGNQLRDLLPLISWIEGQTSKRKAALEAADSGRKADRKSRGQQGGKREPAVAKPVDEFSYVAELAPLHIRRGFVNLTADHWPFFAKSARAETQKVTVVYGGKEDKNCAVWRLVQNDMARLVLTDRVQYWLADNFGASDRIKVDAVKTSSREFRVTLSAA